MTWQCAVCGKHGFGSQNELVVGSPLPTKQRYIGDICNECLRKLLDYDKYEVTVVVKEKENEV